MATEQISLRLPARLLERLDVAARARGARRSELVREAIRSYLEGPGPGEPDRPYTRVEDLVGTLSGGPPDLGRRHREYLKARFEGA